MPSLLSALSTSTGVKIVLDSSGSADGHSDGLYAAGAPPTLPSSLGALSQHSFANANLYTDVQSVSTIGSPTSSLFQVSPPSTLPRDDQPTRVDGTLGIGAAGGGGGGVGQSTVPAPRHYWMRAPHVYEEVADPPCPALLGPTDRAVNVQGNVQTLHCGSPSPSLDSTHQESARSPVPFPTPTPPFGFDRLSSVSEAGYATITPRSYEGAIVGSLENPSAHILLPGLFSGNASSSSLAVRYEVLPNFCASKYNLAGHNIHRPALTQEVTAQTTDPKVQPVSDLKKHPVKLLLNTEADVTVRRGKQSGHSSSQDASPPATSALAGQPGRGWSSPPSGNGAVSPTSAVPTSCDLGNEEGYEVLTPRSNQRFIVCGGRPVYENWEPLHNGASRKDSADDPDGYMVMKGSKVERRVDSEGCGQWKSGGDEMEEEAEGVKRVAEGEAVPDLGVVHHVIRPGSVDDYSTVCLRVQVVTGGGDR